MTTNNPPAGPSKNEVFRERILFALFCILVAFLYWRNVSRNFFLCDDCFISFRYAMNLYHGDGLVWNAGEYVEGYTNFLWVILMAFGLLLHIPPELLSVILGITSGFVILALTLCVSRKKNLSLLPLYFLLPIVFSMSHSFTAWSTSGLATMFHAMLVYLAAICFVRERNRKSRYPLLSPLCFTLAALTRPETILFIGVAWTFLLFEILTRRRPLIALAAWSAPLLVVLGSYLLWRHSYYGYWLPNTYYAKVNGLWFEQGFLYLSLFQEDFRILYFLPVLVPLFFTGKNKFILLFYMSMMGLYLFYLLGIGGDRFEFRFLICLFPFLYGLIGQGILSIATLPVAGGRANGLLVFAAYGAAALLVAATYSGSLESKSKDLRHGIVSTRGMKSYAERRVEEGRFLRTLVESKRIPEDLLIGVNGAGAVPYYSGLPAVDLLGLNDREIAHTPIQERGLIAHEKKASFDYMKKRKIALCEIKNRFIYDEPGKNQKIPGKQGKYYKSIRIGDRYLNFATFLSHDAFKRKFKMLLGSGSQEPD